MTGAIDGAYDTPEGRKLFVSLRPGESSDEFVSRGMGFLQAMGDGHALDRVLASAASDWEALPSDRWLDAVSRSDSRLRLRVTDLSSSGGSSVGHLVVDCEGDPIADDWGISKRSRSTCREPGMAWSGLGRRHSGPWSTRSEDWVTGTTPASSGAPRTWSEI